MSPSNLMLSLQHDTGRWCTEYTYSAEDGMWGVRCLHNFGKIGSTAADLLEESSKSRSKPKRVDEEDAMEGGLKGRISAGAEFYLSRQEKSAGGEQFTYLLPSPHSQLYYQSPLVSVLRHYPMRHLHLSSSTRLQMSLHLLANPHNRPPRLLLCLTPSSDI